MSNTLNPYPIIGTQLTTGLDTIAKALNPASTVDDLVTAIYNYIQPIYYPTTPVPQALQVEIKSVVYNIINAYNNESLGSTIMYGPQQINFISFMLGLKTTNTTPINAIGSWLLDIEDNISKADLSLAAQTPLLLATEMGESVYAYWISKIGTPGSWKAFFDANPAINYANIPFWTAACMEGALIGAHATNKGLIAPTTEIVSVDIISSLIAGLAIAAGKVIFKWVPRIQPKKLCLNKETISNLNGNNNEVGGIVRSLQVCTYGRDGCVAATHFGGMCAYNERGVGGAIRSLQVCTYGRDGCVAATHYGGICAYNE